MLHLIFLYVKCISAGRKSLFRPALIQYICPPGRKTLCRSLLIISARPLCEVKPRQITEWSRVTCKGFFCPALIQCNKIFDLQSFLMMVVLQLLLYENEEICDGQSLSIRKIVKLVLLHFNEQTSEWNFYFLFLWHLRTIPFNL